MTIAGAIEVIDLTHDSSEIEEIPALKVHRSSRSAERERKKRKASVALEEGEILSSGLSRASSPRYVPELPRAQLGESSRQGAGTGRLKKLKKKDSKSASSRDSPQPQTEAASRDKTPTDDASLFFVDVTPATALDQTLREPPVPFSSTSSATASSPSIQTPPVPSLLLPAHVSLIGVEEDGPIQIIRLPSPGSQSDAGSYIEYLDYGDHAAGVSRYFDDRSEETKKARAVCKKCGAEGDHTTKDCPVLICLTCGARDEHSTFSCPISRTCFNCGMRGHMNKNCPNRRASDRDLRDDCGRCGSHRHHTNECPSHWRIYEYVSDSERQATLEARDGMQQLQLGEGGEAYIARDEWCYNCGGVGHLGDDCKVSSHIDHIPNEPSAFSAYNTASGPFSDVDPDTNSRTRGPREWENGSEFTDGWGFRAPSNVGQQARSKDRKRMAERARRAYEEDEDEDDWFNDPSRNMRIRGAAAVTSSQPRKDPPRTIKFAVSGGGTRDRGKAPAESQKPPLQSRIDSRDRRKDHRDLSASESRRYKDGGQSKRKPNEREWDRGKGRFGFSPERDSKRRDLSSRLEDRPRAGPRYHGGYTR